MNPLRRIFQFTFGCRHRHLSRVFTIKHRTTGFASIVDMNSNYRTFMRQYGTALPDAPLRMNPRHTH